ncbi:MAG: type VI secretion system protein ImpG [Flavobacteriales bacterium]|jgi:type VI secretion system protein ImpG
MSDSLISHYEKELAFIQESAGNFALQHPAAASRLQLSENTVDDPLVSRLLSGFAFLNARVQQKLEDDFPELTDAILDTLYPHYLRPIPSMSIVQFTPEENADEAAYVDRGELIETATFNNQNCRFSTGYPVTIEPIKVQDASLMPRPFIAPASNQIPGAAAVLKIALEGLSDDFDFSTAFENNLRFFLKGQSQHTYPLYELLLGKTIKIALAKNENDPSPILINADILRQVGFEREDGLLPYPKNSFIGYQLLTEYFVFPEKFLFLDIERLSDLITDNFGNKLYLYFYLSESNDELEHQINKDIFALGCTPIINLFEYTADPIPLTHHEYKYHVVPDARRADGLEVYSIESVRATDSEGNIKQFHPFYNASHKSDNQKNSAYWCPHRRTITEGEHHNEYATEIDISLVDLDFKAIHSNDKILDLRLICSNRNLPKKLPHGKGHPPLQMVDGNIASPIEFIIPPTATIRPPFRTMGYWRLISHLNLNHLSLGQDDHNPDALKEILRLYDFKDSASTRNLIESIQSVATKPIMAPIRVENTTALCRGTEVNITFDPVMLTGTSPLLISSVLERFLGLYCSINSFTRMVSTLQGKEGDLKRWPPRAGEKTLL